MSHPKKSQNPNLKFISEKRKKEVEEVFKTLGLMNQNSWPNYSSYPSEGYNEPFKKFSMLKNKKTIFTSSS